VYTYVVWFEQTSGSASLQFITFNVVVRVKLKFNVVHEEDHVVGVLPHVV
jgi:hypothetical protein